MAKETIASAKTFTIKKGESMYDIFVNLWRLLDNQFHWNDWDGQKILKEFKTRLPEVNIYFDALDLAKEFTKKIDYRLVEEEEEE